MRGANPPPRPELRAGWIGALIALCLGLWAGVAHAQTEPIHGRLELQDAGQVSGADSLPASLGERDGDDALANLRLTWEPTFGPWSLQVHNLLSVEDGSNVVLVNDEAGLLKAPPATMFDLTGDIVSDRHLAAIETIDRLSLAYSTPNLVVRMGRQALTWGSGLVFRPMDLFDPFSPSATDTEFKPGVDMLYVQELFADGSDLQFIAAPRPDHFGGPPTSNSSSFALHFHTSILGHPTTFLVARDRGDWVGAAGVNGALGGATWNLEVVPTFERSGATRVSGLANISDAVTLLGRSATVFAEYFHNGFGAGGGPSDLASLPADLTARLARGQLFDTRRDYLAGGVTVEVNPLLTLSPTLIADLNDGSVFVLMAASYSVADNVVLAAGAQAPVGRRGSEFGGLPLAPGSATLLAPPGQIYIQLRRYF